MQQTAVVVTMSFQKGSMLAKLQSYGLLNNNMAGEIGFITLHVDAQEGSS
jgi:hypothetical protein